MGTVHAFTGSPGGVHNGGEEPPMTDYVTHAEFKSAMSDISERFVRVESRLEQTATKADMAELRGEMKAYMADTKAELIKWMVGTAIALGASAVTVMTFVLNNATPKAPAAQSAPIIIQVPAPPAASPAK